MQRGAGSSRSWPVLAAGLVILAGVAAAGRWLTRASVSNDAVASGATRATSDAVRLVFVALFLFGSVCLILAVANGSLLGPDRGRGRRAQLGAKWAATLIGVVLLVLLGIWFVNRRPDSPRRPVEVVLPPIAHGTRPTTTTTTAWNGDWVLVGALLLVGAAVLAIWAVARRREARPLAGRGVPSVPLAAQASEAPAELEVRDGHLDPAVEVDPRRAVVIAYHRLLVLLASRGRARWRSEAPLEHLDRVLVARSAGMGPARSLVATFERAEYSDHPITGEDRNQALAWLAAVLADLDRAGPESTMTEAR